MASRQLGMKMSMIRPFIADPTSATLYVPRYSLRGPVIRMTVPRGSTRGSAATMPGRVRSPVAVLPAWRYAVADTVIVFWREACARLPDPSTDGAQRINGRVSASDSRMRPTDQAADGGALSRKPGSFFFAVQLCNPTWCIPVKGTGARMDGFPPAFPRP